MIEVVARDREIARKVGSDKGVSKVVMQDKR